MPIIKFLKEEILKLKEELKSLSESNIFLRAENDGLKQEIIELKRRLNQDVVIQVSRQVVIHYGNVKRESLKGKGSRVDVNLVDRKDIRVIN